MTERELRDWLPVTAVEDGAVLSRRGDLTFGWRVWLPTAFTVNEAGYDTIIHSFIQAYKLLPPWCVVHKQDVFCHDVYRSDLRSSYLSRAYDKHFQGRRFLNGHTYLYLTFSTKSVLERKVQDSGFLGIADSKSLSRETIESRASLASQFAAVLGSNSLLVLEPLTSGDFVSMDRNGRDAGVIPDYLRMWSPDGPDYNFEFHKDNVTYGDNIFKVWYVEDSDAYPGQVSSVKFVPEMSSGASRVFLSGGSPIGYNLHIPHVVNRYVLTLPRSTVERELDQRRRLMTSLSGYSSSCAVNSEELSGYLLDAANEGTITVKCHMNIACWCDKLSIPDVRNAVVTAFSNLDVSVVEETRVVPLFHYAGIPGAEAELGYDNYLNSELTAFLCHGLWDGHDFGVKGGVVRVCDRSRMIPLTIDIQALARSMGRINNMNCLVVGPSGSGKSFTMNSLVQNFYEADEHIMIIDVGDSYEGLCAVVREVSGGADGVYNTYDPEHPFCFNPFKGWRTWGGTDSDGDNNSGEDFIFSLLQTIYQPEKGWENDKPASAVLSFLIGQFLDWWGNGVPASVSSDLGEAHANARRMRAKRSGRTWIESDALKGWKNPVTMVFPDDRAEDPIFDDFYRYVTKIVSPLVSDGLFKMGDVTVTDTMLDIDKFGASMDMFKAGGPKELYGKEEKPGKYGFLLNSRDESDLFSSRLTVFEVDKIKDNNELFPLWVLCIMHSFEDKMRSLPCQKVMVIEEAWKAIATPTMSGYIKWLFRTARKFKTSAVVVTQSITDLTGSDVIKDSIIQNTDVKILLDQRKNANNFQNAIKTLGLSPMAVNLALSVNQDLNPDYRYKEAFFAIGEEYCNVFAIEVSPEQALVFETDKTLKKPLFDLAARKGSIIDAVEETLEERRRNERERRSSGV